jgi:hypothetical protein
VPPGSRGGSGGDSPYLLGNTQKAKRNKSILDVEGGNVFLPIRARKTASNSTPHRSCELVKLENQ